MESTTEKSYNFPPEILMLIFAYVDVRTLVFSCRHVCRFWKDSVESPDLWKIKMFREHGDQFETDIALSRAYQDYPWYMCYAICRNVFGKNLFVYSNGMPPTWSDSYNIGYFWPVKLNACTEGFGAFPQQLLDEGENDCFLCNFGGNSADQTIDLYAQGLTRKIMEYQPPIYISEWFAVRFDYIAFCHIEVILFTSDGRYDSQHGYFPFVHQIGLHEWFKVSHTFTNYSPDVRYVVFRHGIDTNTPDIHGTFNPLLTRSPASKIAATKLIVSRPEPSRPSDSTSSSSSDS